MRKYLIAVLMLLLGCVSLNAQLAMQRAVAPDTLTVKTTGTIKVRKKPIRPYVRVDYTLSAACVTKVSVPTVFDSLVGEELVETPLFDTNCRPQNLQRALPQKTVQLGRTYAQNISYEYLTVDTPRTDTLMIGFWIDTQGRIRQAFPEDSTETTLPPALYEQLVGLTKTFGVWGDKGGGYYTTRKFLRPSEFKRQDYYCTARVIVSNRPLTPEQKRAGESSIPVMDYPYGGAVGVERR